jgi:hypothetical protein
MLFISDGLSGKYYASVYLESMDGIGPRRARSRDGLM